MQNESETLPAGPFVGRQVFQEHITRALSLAQGPPWREMIWLDPDFFDWPLDDPRVLEGLERWVRNGERLWMLALHYDTVVQRFPRFVNWRRRWSHKLDCRAADDSNSDLPSLLWSPAWVLQRHDLVRCGGIAGSEPQRRKLTRTLADDWLMRSSPAFPADVLGL